MRVELQDIKKYFGSVKANDGINLIFEPGKIYGLLGENGAGKSTLMKILSGYQAQTDGQIIVDGKPTRFISPSDALQKGVGMLYQDPLDFPPLRIVENHLLAYDDSLVLDMDNAESTLGGYGERFGFDVDDPQRYVESMSLGERQQLELSRLLSLGADLLILDEPTTGISAEQKDILFTTMRRLAHEEQKTIILVSHKLEEVQELCDAIAVLRRGQMIGTKQLPCPNSELVQLMFGEELVRTGRDSVKADPVTLAVKDTSIHTYRLDVENISFDLHAGEVLGFAGLEGSGQRLILEACAGLLPLQSGSVELDGEELKGKPSPAQWMMWLVWGFLTVRVVWLLVKLILGQITGFGFVGGTMAGMLFAGAAWLLITLLIEWTKTETYHAFQDRGGAYLPAGRLEEGLVAGLSLTEHMSLSDSHAVRIDKQKDEAEIARRIEHYNIIGSPGTHVDALSGGNQQRAMFALLKPELRLLLVEHPTRGLDVTSANWIWELLQGRCKTGTSILFISADLDELLERSDRIAVFSGGKMSQIVQSDETSVKELGHLIGGE